MEKEISLISPFNGERVVFPPELPQATLDALLRGGFIRADEERKTLTVPKKKES